MKVASLLQIMEKTNQFMQRIGLRLREQSAATAALADTTTTVEPAAPAHRASAGAEVSQQEMSDAYQRFKAYVSSTKDEFRLVHRVDVFVAAQPAGLRATLLPHQLDGLRFLVSLHHNNINGILADEIGGGARPSRRWPSSCT
ncbi:hypothetical protein STCU_12173 [Strigomonas culicis]|uniref:Uncharacterized protein n=1 Tax=Strigomonas culicis TaxID=28005 RepID=S9TG00_9TRYP|nr:hypothetical protein STCU_12173 [Strigomonas culicis]|eukprot:EPY15273.1 hypothetical protein STCU_12173 [Strigomonas culicis]